MFDWLRLNLFLSLRQFCRRGQDAGWRSRRRAQPVFALLSLAAWQSPNNAQKAAAGLPLPEWGLQFLALVALLSFIWLAYRARGVRLKEQQAQQEFLTRRLIESQESERQRIAAELHDGLGQHLLLIKNSALVALNALPPENPARLPLADISEQTSLALDEVRQIAHNLRPYQLERFGLTAALQHMVRQVRTSSDIDFITHIDDVDNLLPREAEVSLYRIVQECVNNVLKHSEAHEAWLEIRRTGTMVSFTCRDNGKGFDTATSFPSPVALTDSFGLTGIAERAHLLGGHFSLQSAPGAGAKISIWLDATETPL